MAMGCGGKLGMVFLIVLNVIFLLLGLALLVTGIVMQVDSGLVTDKVLPFLNNIEAGAYQLGDLAKALSIVLLVIGAFIFVVAALGAFGACCKVRVMLVVYAIIVIIFIIAEVTVVILWFTMREKLDSYIKGQLDTLMVDYAGPTATDSKSASWNALFLELKCCGIDAITATQNDFMTSAWWTSGDHGASLIPSWCCKEVTSATATNDWTACTDTPATYFTTGCYDKVNGLLNTYSTVFIAVGITTIVVEILAVIFAFCVCSGARDDGVV